MKENERRVLVMPDGGSKGYSFSGSRAYFKTVDLLAGGRSDRRIGFALTDSLGVESRIIIDYDKDPEEFRIFVEGGNITIKE